MNDSKVTEASPSREWLQDGRAANALAQDTRKRETPSKFMARRTSRRRPGSTARHPKLPPVSSFDARLPAALIVAPTPHQPFAAEPSQPTGHDPAGHHARPSSAHWPARSSFVVPQRPPEAAQSLRPPESPSGLLLDAATETQATRVSPRLRMSSILSGSSNGPYFDPPAVEPSETPIGSRKATESLAPLERANSAFSDMPSDKSLYRHNHVNGFGHSAALASRIEQPPPGALVQSTARVEGDSRMALDSEPTRPGREYSFPLSDSPSIPDLNGRSYHSNENGKSCDTIYVATDKDVATEPSTPSESSSDLPSTSHIIESLDAQYEARPEREPSAVPSAEAEVSEEHPQDWGVDVGPRDDSVDASPAAASPAAEVMEVDSPGLHVISPVGDKISEPAAQNVEETAGNSIKIMLQDRVRHRPFDSAALDMAIYRQPGAAPAPFGVPVASQAPEARSDTTGRDQRLYVHANPAIHQRHQRPQEWYQRKHAEIKARGSRKLWFGKVAARLRCVREWETKEAERRKAAARKGQLPEQVDPQPRTFARPLDFGDVPETELPQEVQQNAEWMKACAFFREDRRIRNAWRTDLKRCEKETNDYLMMIEQGQHPASGRRH